MTAPMAREALRLLIAQAKCLRDTRPSALCVRGFYKHPECVAAALTEALRSTAANDSGGGW